MRVTHDLPIQSSQEGRLLAFGLPHLLASPLHRLHHRVMVGVHLAWRKVRSRLVSVQSFVLPILPAEDPRHGVKVPLRYAIRVQSVSVKSLVCRRRLWRDILILTATLVRGRVSDNDRLGRKAWRTGIGWRRRVRAHERESCIVRSVVVGTWSRRRMGIGYGIRHFRPRVSGGECLECQLRGV
jgi:hypothetical protein